MDVEPKIPKWTMISFLKQIFVLITYPILLFTPCIPIYVTFLFKKEKCSKSIVILQTNKKIIA